MSRREFKTSVRVEIIKRATRFVSFMDETFCEKCCQPTKHRFEIHHVREDGLEVDKSRPLTAADGALWCLPCHKEHTATVSVPVVAKAKRREAAHLGARRDKQKIASDPHALKSHRRPTHEGRPPANGPTALARVGFVSVGDLASDVMAKLNPKKAAE